MVIVGGRGTGYRKETRVDRLQVGVDIPLAIHEFGLESELVSERFI